jgi:hypothetical protein
MISLSIINVRKLHNYKENEMRDELPYGSRWWTDNGLDELSCQKYGGKQRESAKQIFDGWYKNEFPLVII